MSHALRRLGHEPRIIPAFDVKPYVKGQKNDYDAAEAIAEAALRTNLRTAREKSQEQLNLQACHCVRSRLVSHRTAAINRIRVLPRRAGHCRASRCQNAAQLAVHSLNNREAEISPRMSELITGPYETGSRSTSEPRRLPGRLKRSASARATTYG